jgi:hypothetical protein
MAQYKIEATSEKKNLTVSNIAPEFIPNPEEETTQRATQFPSPANFATKAEADEQATKFADWLNHEDHQCAFDWVGKATAV